MVVGVAVLTVDIEVEINEDIVVLTLAMAVVTVVAVVTAGDSATIDPEVYSAACLFSVLKKVRMFAVYKLNWPSPCIARLEAPFHF